MVFKSDKKEPRVAGIKSHIYLNSLFFLFLGVSSNYIGDTLGPNLQKLFTDSLFFKQIIILITIYFGLDLSSDKRLNPFSSIKATILIYFIFTLIANFDYRISVSILFLLTLIYFESNYREYEVKYNEKMTQKKFDYLVGIRSNIIKMVIALVIIGGFLFLKKNKLIPESISM